MLGSDFFFFLFRIQRKAIGSLKQGSMCSDLLLTKSTLAVEKRLERLLRSGNQ